MKQQNTNSDLRSCARMKAYRSDKESSKLFEQKTAISSRISIRLLVGEYCKKLTQQNLF